MKSLCHENDASHLGNANRVKNNELIIVIENF